MMKVKILFLLIFISSSIYAQKDSLNLGDKYWEDQMYINVSYNVLLNQPKSLPGSSFSYGLALGYIKDIPLNKQGNYAFGVGIGYNYDSFNNGLKVAEENNSVVFSKADGTRSNTTRLQFIEFPIQFRFRTSDAVTYSFWRVYAGLSVKYNIYNSFTNEDDSGKIRVTNIENFNNWMTDLTLSAGYGTFNLYISYSLQPMFKNAFLNGEKVDSKILRVGLSFYLL